MAMLNYHAGLFLFHVYITAYDVKAVDIGWDTYGGKFKFLTFLNLLIQTSYFGLALANDIWGSNFKPSDKKGRRTRLQKFLDTYLASIVYPVGVFVVMTFWGIYAIDRELVFPKRLDKIIPLWLNHIEHTTVLPLLMLEKFLVYHEYPNRRRGLAIMLAFASSYLIWILWIAYYTDIWVYPILQVMEGHQRAMFIVVLMAFFISIYILGEALNNYMWRKERAFKAPKLKVKKES